MILADAKSLALAHGLELVEDEGLLDEVAGLVEWPVVLMGEFEAEFLDIPPEVIRATIRANQKCFVLRDHAGQARQQVPAGLQPRRARRRRGDCGRQRARRARAAVRRAAFLGDRSRPTFPTTRERRQAARPAARQAARRSASCSTKSSARRASGSSASPRWRGRWRRRSAACPISPSARRGSPRPISSPRWSASSRNCRA